MIKFGFIDEIKNYFNNQLNLEAMLITLHYVLVTILLVIVFIYQIKRRPFECIAYFFPCIINLLSLGLVNTARYSIGTGIFVLGFSSLLFKSPKWIKILAFFVLSASAIGLQYAWFEGHGITIG